MGTQTDDDGLRHWQIALVAGGFDAGLSFDAGFDLEMREYLLLASVGYRVSPDLTVGFRAGGVLDGELTAEGRTWDVALGAMIGAQAEYRFVARPVTLSGTLGLAASFTATREVGGAGEESSLTALDLRAGVTVSRELFDAVTPYFSARAFGGPVFWTRDGEDVVGSDRGHYQLALGLTAAPADFLALGVEWAFLGETGLYGQLAIAF
ncbi:MAG: hypothetical protein EP329_18425 [Deltaproteobacteria bacterium]|nr:MAG: hypothetical protein EP329_18425 [Deltaproteobacteria bacterium]